MVAVGYSWFMGRKIWTAPELEALSPAEQDKVFAASIITDLNDVPAEFLASVRERLQERVAGFDAPPRPQ